MGSRSRRRQQRKLAARLKGLEGQQQTAAGRLEIPTTTGMLGAREEDRGDMIDALQYLAAPAWAFKRGEYPNTMFIDQRTYSEIEKLRNPHNYRCAGNCGAFFEVAWGTDQCAGWVNIVVGNSRLTLCPDCQPVVENLLKEHGFLK